MHPGLALAFNTIDVTVIGDDDKSSTGKVPAEPTKNYPDCGKQNRGKTCRIKVVAVAPMSHHRI